MNKIFYRLLLTAVVIGATFHCNDELFAQNGSAPGQYGGDDPFRIGMGLTSGPNNSAFGPNAPGIPKNAPYWNDVGDWQVFLIEQGMDFYDTGNTVTDPKTGTVYPIYAGLDSSHPNGVFDQATEDATKAWQKVNKVKKVTGIVDDPTYHAAISIDPTFTKTTKLHAPFPPEVPNTTRPNLDGDFGDRGQKEHNGDTNHDIYLEPGHGPHGPGACISDDPSAKPHHHHYWSDISRWQDFLKRCGGQGSVLGDAYPNNNFDALTVTATQNFQNSVGMTNPTGIVDKATLQKAKDAIKSCKLPLSAPADSSAAQPATDAAQPASPPKP